MFFVDKYSPLKDSDTIKFHKNESKLLDTMSQDSSIPHLIFYGPEGSGKKNTIEAVYGKSL